MIWFYAAAAIFGCAFLVPMVLGGLDSDVGDSFGGDLGTDFDTGIDTDFGGGPELDVDLDADVDVEGVGEGGDASDATVADVGAGSPLGAIFASLLSFRTVVFFSAFFGTSGIVFDLLGYSSAVVLATAVLIGVIAAFANSLLFGLIRSSQTTSHIDDRTLEGRPARVVLPMDETTRGRIRIDLSGQPQYLVAKPMAGQRQRFDVGDSVVVVSFEHGTAVVASLAELDSSDEPDLPGPPPELGSGEES